jgi:hypothetical protein
MKKKSRKKRSNLFGTPATSKRKGKNRFSMDNIKDEGMPVVLVAAGVIAANFVGKTIDGFVPANNNAMKKAIKPIALAGAGLALKILSDNKMLKDFGTGLAIGGLLSGVKAATKQNLLENLSGDLEQLNPDLPDIAGYLESSFDGDLEDVDGDLEYADAEVIDGDDDDLDGDDDDLDGDLPGRKRKGRKGRGRRKMLSPAAEETPLESIDFI